MRSLPLLLAVTTVASAAPDPAPPPEVVVSTTKVDLPAVPAFDLPPIVDGVHGARELRIAGRDLLGTDVKVSGYITWIYDCTTSVAKAGETRVQAQARVDADPTLCQRPRFFLGEAKDTPVETGLWVVEVPRAPNKLELTRLDKGTLAKMPPAPKIAVGDYVTVTGKFALTAPHGDRNSDGLVVFATVAKATPSQPLTAITDEKPVPPMVQLKPRAKKAIGAKQQNESADHLSAANKLGSAGKLDEAIAEYQKATEIWPDNHLAWYGLATIHVARGNWADAAKAFDEAVSLRPDVALYLMWRGVVGYEQEMAHPDTANFDQPWEYLTRAVAAAPQMWRAQWTLGRIERARGHARRAAQAFTKTIEANPGETNPYIALAELYRKWDYIDQSIAVALQGTTATAKPGDLWYVLGMGYERKSTYDKAIDAFTKALEGGKAPASTVYHRGRMEFAKKDYANAKRDLEAFVGKGEKGSFEMEVAVQLLGQIPAKH